MRKTFFVPIKRELLVKVEAETAAEARFKVERGLYDWQSQQEIVKQSVGRAVEEI